jgi:hypothetical protein
MVSDALASGGIAKAAERREQRRQQDMDPLVGFALAHVEQLSLDHLNGGAWQSVDGDGVEDVFR